MEFFIDNEPHRIVLLMEDDPHTFICKNKWYF